MAIVFDNLVIDRPLWGIFRDSNMNVLGGLNQIQNLSISNTSESKDKTDAAGVLIKRFFTSKAVELSAENALFSLSLMGIQTGNAKVDATAENKIIVPMIRQFKKPQTGAWTFTLPKTPIEGTLSVTALTSSGVPDTTHQYELATELAPGKYIISGTTVTIGVDEGDDAYVPDRVQATFMYESENGARVLQSGDKFPKECELILAVLVSDVCDKEIVRLAYITFPAFQMSPDFDITLDTDSPHPFSGTATLDYCDDEKGMYSIAISEDDEGDE